LSILEDKMFHVEIMSLSVDQAFIN